MSVSHADGRASRRSWVYLGLAIVAFLFAAFAYSGAVMAGSFTIANHRDADHWHRVGVAYGWLTLWAVIGFIAAVAAFVRNRRRDRAAIAKQAV